MRTAKLGHFKTGTRSAARPDRKPELGSFAAASIVPIYQRNYAWTARDELEPFWEHLVNKAEERLAGQRSKFPHYMGALIVIPDGEFAFGQVQTFNVVDGQQRLSTFQIALAAFAGVPREIKADADLAKEANPEATVPAYGEDAETVATHIFALLLNPEKTLRDVANEPYKLQPTRIDRKHFRDLVNLGRGSCGKNTPITSSGTVT